MFSEPSPGFCASVTLSALHSTTLTSVTLSTFPFYNSSSQVDLESSFSLRMWILTPNLFLYFYIVSYIVKLPNSPPDLAESQFCSLSEKQKSLKSQSAKI